MTEEKSPQTEQKPVGVMDALKGAKSRDLDEPQTPVESQAVAEKEPEPATEPKAPEVPEVDSDANLKLKQEIARLQRHVSQMGPYAQLGLAVKNDPKGQKAIERWQRGGKIFIESPEHVGDGAEPKDAEVQERPEKPLTRQDVQELLNVRDAAAKQVETLDEIGRENLEHYDKVKKNRLYVEFLNSNLAAVWRGEMELDEDTYGWTDENLARNYTAVKRSYRQILADNPKVIEAAKEAGKKEQAERAEAALAASGSSGSGTSGSSAEPPAKTPEQELIDRMVNSRGIGKPFGTVARKK